MGTEDIFEDVTMPLYGRAVEASVDPMCGTEVEHTPMAVSLRLGNDIVYFCSDFCRKRFRQDRSEAVWLTQVGKRRRWRTPAGAPEQRLARRA